MRKISFSVVLSSLLLCWTAAATGADLKKTCYHRDAPSETDIGYCEAVRIGNTLVVSGSVGKGEMSVAMHMAYDALKSTLAANGLDFRHVVKETVYTPDLDGFIKNKQVRRNYYANDLPAATWVQVQRLYRPEFVVEVELTAAFPDDQEHERQVREQSAPVPGTEQMSDSTR
jgi:enamine deaminase RidA (YjgF/YER057c/UK114 family)